jgi:hypothetical protein
MLEHLGFLAEQPREEAEVRADDDCGIQHAECERARLHGPPNPKSPRESDPRGRELARVEEGQAERKARLEKLLLVTALAGYRHTFPRQDHRPIDVASHERDAVQSEQRPIQTGTILDPPGKIGRATIRPLDLGRPGPLAAQQHHPERHLQAQLCQRLISARQAIDQAQPAREMSDRFRPGESARRIFRRDAKETDRAPRVAPPLEMQRKLGGDLV